MRDLTYFAGLRMNKDDDFLWVRPAGKDVWLSQMNESELRELVVLLRGEIRCLKVERNGAMEFARSCIE